MRKTVITRAVRLAVAAAAGALIAAAPAFTQAASAAGGNCAGRTMYDLDGNGRDPGVLDTTLDRVADQNALDMNLDGAADLWLIDKNQDCVLDEGAQDIDGDRSPDVWIVDVHQDGVFDYAYADGLVNGLPNMAAPLQINTGTTLVIQGEPMGGPVSAGPFGEDILEGLRTAPRGNPAGNDYLGGATIAGGLTTLGNAGSVNTY